MKTRICVVWIGIVLGAWSCSPTRTSGKLGAQPMEGKGVEAIPEDNKTRGEVSLTLVKRPPEEDPTADPEAQDSATQDPATQAWEKIDMRLVNRSGQRLWFTGYKETQPWYRIQRLIDGNWQDHRVGWFCGTGLRRCEISAGKSSPILVSLRKDLYPVRIGISYGLGNSKSAGMTVWSARIESR